jgi:exonuclease SbcD
VALGHIHKSQDLNTGNHPPVIYPGSIERVDFGEAKDDKFFVIADVSRGHTQVEWCKLEGIRPFVDRFVRLDSQEEVTERILEAFPPLDQLKGAIVRLVLEYPRDWEASIDEASIREYLADAFSFSLEKRAQVEGRIRLPGDQAVGSLSALELLDLYWRASHVGKVDVQALNQLATDLIRDFHVTQSEGE